VRAMSDFSGIDLLIASEGTSALFKPGSRSRLDFTDMACSA
jgi:hypothetical protein